MKIELSPASSTVLAHGYDQETKTMNVHFRNGNQYFYKDVPQRVYENFLMARSKGRFHMMFIKDRYACTNQTAGSKNADGGQASSVPAENRP